MQPNSNSMNRSVHKRSALVLRRGNDKRSNSWKLLALFAGFLLMLCASLGHDWGKSSLQVAGALDSRGTKSLPEDAALVEGMQPESGGSQRKPAGRPTLPPIAPLELSAIPRPRTLVFGALLDDNGTPIPADTKPRVSFVDRGGRRHASNAGSQGAFAISALDFGAYSVTASAAGFQSRTEALELRSDAPRLRKDFSLQKAIELKIYVKTTDGKDLFAGLRTTGAPLGARLLIPVATREPPGNRLVESAGRPNSLRASARFRGSLPREIALDPQCMGVLSLDGELPVWVSIVQHGIVLESICVGVGQGEATFVLSASDLLRNLCTVRAQVIDATTRQPILRARVTLRGGSHYDSGVATDSMGCATLSSREPGSYELQVRVDGYEQYRQPIDARPGEIVNAGTLALASEITVEGRVLDDQGHPLSASFCVGSLDPDDRSIHWFRSGESRSRADGSFKLSGLGRGEYVLRCGNPDALGANEWEGIDWVSGNVPLDTRSGSMAGLELHPQRAVRLAIRVADPRSKELGFRVVDERGLELTQGKFQDREPRALALPSGNYRVLLLDRDETALSERVVALGLEELRIDLLP